MSDFAAKLRARTMPEICECAMGAHLVDGSEPDEDCVKAADTIASLTAEIERLVKQNNVLVRKCDPLLSSVDLKAVDKHCDWVAFGHAYRAMLNVRAAVSGDKHE